MRLGIRPSLLLGSVSWRSVLFTILLASASLRVISLLKLSAPHSVPVSILVLTVVTNWSQVSNVQQTILQYPQKTLVSLRAYKSLRCHFAVKTLLRTFSCHLVLHSHLDCFPAWMKNIPIYVQTSPFSAYLLISNERHDDNKRMTMKRIV